MTELGNSDSLLAVLPGGKLFRMRVPYPLGFFARSSHARIDDPTTGWKGRAIWSSYAGYAAWHVEGGVGEKAKVVKFQRDRIRSRSNDVRRVEDIRSEWPGGEAATHTRLQPVVTSDKVDH